MIKSVLNQYFQYYSVDSNISGKWKKFNPNPIEMENKIKWMPWICTHVNERKSQVKENLKLMFFFSKFILQTDVTVKMFVSFI